MRMLLVRVQTHGHRVMPLSYVLTHTDKYMCLVPIYTDELNILISIWQNSMQPRERDFGTIQMQY